MRQPAPRSSRPAGLPAYRPAPKTFHAAPSIAPAAVAHSRGNERSKKTVTVASFFDARSTEQNQLPMIRLRGQWLQRLGFRAGERLIVTEEDGRIVLTLVRDEEK